MEITGEVFTVSVGGVGDCRGRTEIGENGEKKETEVSESWKERWEKG